MTSSFLQDSRYGWRMLRNSPLLTAMAVLTLGLTIGANTAVFSIVNSVLLKPLPIADPDRVMFMTETWNGLYGNMSAGNFVDVQAQSTSYSAMAAIKEVSFNLATQESPERVPGQRTTYELFGLLGVQPLIGRTFTADEDQPGRDQVIVIGEALWRTRFGSQASILGRTIQVDSQPKTVIGVMPAKFDPMQNHDQIWVPIAFDDARRAMHDEHYLLALARLKPGISVAQAQSELDAIGKREQERFPRDNQGRSFSVQPFQETLVAGYRTGLLMLLAAVGFVLLIGCVNIANLQLARARTRRKELAIRVALGASRTRLLMQMISESMVLALVGGATGVLVAYAGIQFLVKHAPQDIARIGEASLDRTALLFAITLTLLSGTLFGAWVALRASRTEPQEAFRDGSRTSSMHSARDRLRGALVVTEIAIALVLLAGAGLLIRSAMQISRVNAGYETHSLLIGRVSLPESQYQNPEQLQIVFRRIAEEAATLPGVQSAAVVSTAPMRGGFTNGLIPQGRSMELSNAIDSRFRLITPTYFSTLKIPVRRGRVFNDSDTSSGQRVMLINETLARAAFGSEDPVGKQIACCEADNSPEQWKTVVGVVGDIRASGLDRDVPPEFYLPLTQAPKESWEWMERSMDIVVRSSIEPTSLVPALRKVVENVAAGVPLYRIETVDERIDALLGQMHFQMYLLISFAAVALLLAAIGIYGVLSYVVSQRTHEIGVRMAIGASERDVLALVVGQAMWLTVLGLLIGITGALALTRLLKSLLYGVSTTDVPTFAAVAALLAGTAILASYIPARRAAKVDPMAALRYE
ncbi:MAG TPA: ABC transporter permease [Terriglobales bacterium]|nr:ABC transporter permease [Terriglobales bacterium]